MPGYFQSAADAARTDPSRISSGQVTDPRNDPDLITRIWRYLFTGAGGKDGVNRYGYQDTGESDAAQRAWARSMDDYTRQGGIDKEIAQWSGMGPQAPAPAPTTPVTKISSHQEIADRMQKALAPLLTASNSTPGDDAIYTPTPGRSPATDDGAIYTPTPPPPPPSPVLSGSPAEDPRGGMPGSGASPFASPFVHDEAGGSPNQKYPIDLSEKGIAQRKAEAEQGRRARAGFFSGGQAFSRGGYPELFTHAVRQNPTFASGGNSQYVGGSKGLGNGRSDHIEARLSPGEYVMDAETVAMLGDGDNEAGAAQLDKMRERLRKHKGRALAKGKFSAKAKSAHEYLIR